MMSKNLKIVIAFLLNVLFLTMNNFALALSVGEKAPVFNLRNINGELVMPFAEKDNPIVLSFFFSECVICKNEIKDLYELSKKYPKVKVFLVGTSFKPNADVTTEVRNYIKELNVDFVPLVDKYKEIIRTYKVQNYPTVMLIDKNGTIAYKSEKYDNKTIAEIEQKIKINLSQVRK